MLRPARVRPWTRGLAWAALPAAVAVLAYANTLGHGFALDDLRLVRDNPAIRSIGELPSLFVQPYWPEREAGLYRPVAVASLALNRWLTGSGPRGFHVANVLLHAVVSMLVWFVARRAAPYYGAALATALLFAVHPLHVEAVANVAGRAELLAALGTLAAWLAHRQAAEATAPRARLASSAAAAVAWVAALGAKEHVILAPLLFAFDDLLRRRTKPGNAGRPPRSIWLLYGAAAALYTAGRFAALGSFGEAGLAVYLDNPPAFLGPAVRIGTALWTQALYLGLFVWPATLLSDYSFDALPAVRSLGDPRWLAGAIVAGALVAVAVAGFRRRARTIALGAAIWIAFFLPTANLLFPTGTVMAERLAYLPSLGACLLAGHVAGWSADAARSPLARWPRARLVLPAAFVVLATLALGARTVARNPVWRDNATLARNDVALAPRSAKLQLGAGLALHEAGDTRGAEAAFRTAVEIWPDYAQARFNLGQLLLQRGAEDEAIEQLEAATRIAPANPRPYKTLAPLLDRRGEHERALEAYRTGARLDPSDFALRFNHGRALLAAERNAEAREVLERLAGDAPRALEGQLASALLREAAGDLAGALAVYREIARRPDVPPDVRRRVAAKLSAGGVEPPR